MPIVSNDFSDIVYNRRSIRKFDTSVKIPREEMLEILDKTVTAPSSVNMQPWRFVVVDSEEGKDKLKPFVSYNGVQNETSSAMVLIFCRFEEPRKSRRNLWEGRYSRKNARRGQGETTIKHCTNV